MYFISTAVLFFLFSYRFYWTADKKKQQSGPGFELISHRGLTFNAPENTMESYIGAVDNGFRWIELDLVVSKDQVLFCSHNLDFESQTDLKGYFFDFNSNKIKDGFTGVYSGYKGSFRIPEFLNVLRRLPVDIGINVELKFKSWSDISTARALINCKDILTKRPFVISSFSPTILMYIKMFFRAAPVGMLLESYKYMWLINWIHPDYINPRADMLNPSFIKLCKKRNLKILTWTVNNIKTINACLGMGVQGIITDERKVS